MVFGILQGALGKARQPLRGRLSGYQGVPVRSAVKVKCDGHICLILVTMAITMVITMVNDYG